MHILGRRRISSLNECNLIIHCYDQQARRGVSNLLFLPDSHQSSVGDTENKEDSEEESEFSADEFVKRTLNHALSRRLSTLQRHAASWRRRRLTLAGAWS